MFGQLEARDYSDCAMKIALVSWSAIHAHVQAPLASFFQSLLHQKFKAYLQLSTLPFAASMRTQAYCFSTVLYIKNDNLLVLTILKLFVLTCVCEALFSA